MCQSNILLRSLAYINDDDMYSDMEKFLGYGTTCLDMLARVSVH